MNPTANPNQRSCQQCSRKKIRCDKSQPCTNCSKSQLECIFPGSGRAPRRKKRPLKAELISRLNRLEDEIKGLREYTEEANRVNQRSCSENAVVSENAAGGQRGRLIVGNGYSRYVTHDALVNVEDQVG